MFRNKNRAISYWACVKHPVTSTIYKQIWNPAPKHLHIDLGKGFRPYVFRKHFPINSPARSESKGSYITRLPLSGLGKRFVVSESRASKTPISAVFPKVRCWHHCYFKHHTFATTIKTIPEYTTVARLHQDSGSYITYPMHVSCRVHMSHVTFNVTGPPSKPFPSPHFVSFRIPHWARGVPSLRPR